MRSVRSVPAGARARDALRADSSRRARNMARKHESRKPVT